MARAHPSSRTATTARPGFLSAALLQASPNKKPSQLTSPSKARNPSPKKQQRMADEAQEREARQALVNLEALLADFEIEAAAQASNLRRRKADQLAAFERKWKASVAQMDDYLRALPVADLFDKFNGNLDLARSQIVHQTVREAPMSSEELAHRKRAAPGSPRRDGQAAGSSIEDVFGTGKKARAGVAESGRKVVPGSASRGAAARAKANATSPSTARATRARSAQPSISRPPTASSSRLRGSAVFNPALPPTPSIRSRASAAGSAASRRLQRGETLYSVNGSPVHLSGDRFYGSDGTVEEEEGEDEDDEWDIMSAQEASRVEEQGGKSAKKGRTKAAAPSSSQTRSGAGSTLTSPSANPGRLGSKKEAKDSAAATRVPSSTKFAFEPPKEAPSFEAILKRQLAQTESDVAKAALQAMYDRMMEEMLKTRSV